MVLHMYDRTGHSPLFLSTFNLASTVSEQCLSLFSCKAVEPHASPAIALSKLTSLSVLP